MLIVVTALMKERVIGTGNETEWEENPRTSEICLCGRRNCSCCVSWYQPALNLGGLGHCPVKLNCCIKIQLACLEEYMQSFLKESKLLMSEQNLFPTALPFFQGHSAVLLWLSLYSHCTGRAGDRDIPCPSVNFLFLSVGFTLSSSSLRLSRDRDSKATYACQTQPSG